MSTFGYIVLAIVAAIALVALVQARAQAGTHRSLASRQPKSDYVGKVPLGMEATDLNHIQSVSRKNEMLERSNTSVTDRNSGQRTTWGNGLVIKPWADDETYAKRFHSVFQRKDKGPKT